MITTGCWRRSSTSFPSNRKNRGNRRVWIFRSATTTKREASRLRQKRRLRWEVEKRPWHGPSLHGPLERWTPLLNIQKCFGGGFFHPAWLQRRCRSGRQKALPPGEYLLHLWS